MTQKQAMAILKNGKCVLLTGAAGTGKTYLLNSFIENAKKRGKVVAVTATTGLAATHLNGTTIHAWAGIGIHEKLPDKFFEKISKQRREIINKTDILIIDEISMMHDYRLDMIDEVLKKVRKCEIPFGGIQVILCGDFFQLPPINRREGKSGSFVNYSQAWQQNIFTVCYLTKQYRQALDKEYNNILNGIRAGQLKRSQLEALYARRNVINDPFTIRTRLLTTNADVDEINKEHLASIDGEVHEYEMENSGGKQFIESLKKSCLAPETLQLKEKALVMCIKNAKDKSYVNGSLGVVSGFQKATDLPIVELANGRKITVGYETWELHDGEKKRASISQIPLRLAWAITVHKSQGMTLDSAIIDLSKAFVEGMGYVALSRVRDFDSLILDGINNMALKTSKTARQIDASLKAASEQAILDHDLVA